jgi:hypothetical protein
MYNKMGQQKYKSVQPHMYREREITKGQRGLLLGQVVSLSPDHRKSHSFICSVDNNDKC